MKSRSPASARKQRLIPVLLIIAFNIVADQLSKVAAQAWLRGHAATEYLGGAVRFEYAENPGAFLSLGANLPDGARFWVLTVIVGAILGLCIWQLFTDTKIDRTSAFSLALVVGGGLSNLGDRAFREQGRVVDYVSMGIGGLRTGIFNVADVAIMAGVIVLLLETARSRKPAE